MKLSNNNQLYQYLISLSAELKRMGAEELGDVIATASRMVNTFPATEFLGESRMALQRVSREEGGILSGNDHAELLDV
ncbi:MAG TPA: hypothetical protein VFA74_08135, partial [Terriglobales bacterium]|nr:hypothetical protein [Terriglobales bacterium]